MKDNDSHNMFRIAFSTALVCFFLTSCSKKIREVIVDTNSGEIVGGYTSNGTFNLNDKPRKSEMKEFDAAVWREKGIAAFFSYDSLEVLTGLEIRKTQNFSTSKGLKVGDNIQIAKKMYGKPWKEREVNIIIGDESYYLCDAWFYRGLSVCYDTSGQITSIFIGKDLINP